jgi:pantothenate synthetase
MQFGPQEDFASYPRTFEEDCAALEGRRVEVLFAPSLEVTRVQVPGLSAIRRGHSGRCTSAA